MIQLFGVKQDNWKLSADSLQINREQTEFEFQAQGSRQVVASFDGGQLSSDGGALLLRDLDRRLGLEKRWPPRRASPQSASGRVPGGVCLGALGVQSLRGDQREVVIDLDATDDPLHGRQEGRFFHGYYDAYCYLPLYAFIADAIVRAQLRTANRDGSDGTVEALKRIVATVRRRCPKARIVVRAGSGFCRGDILS